MFSNHRNKAIVLARDHNYMIVHILLLLGTQAGNLINSNSGTWFMRKLLAIIEALFDGGASIDYVKKTRVSKPPGDVTDVPHN